MQNLNNIFLTIDKAATHNKLFNLIELNKVSDIDCCKMESQIPHIWELLCVKRALDMYNKKSL